MIAWSGPLFSLFWKNTCGQRILLMSLWLVLLIFKLMWCGMVTVVVSWLGDDLFLFGEATDGQMNCMKDTLDNICSTSGQMVNVGKTTIIFAKCVPRKARLWLVNQSGFKEVSYLWKYLGVPLIGRTPRREDYAYLIDAMKNKLSGWKASQLSFVVRVTLYKSIIELLPLFIPWSLPPFLKVTSVTSNNSRGSLSGEKRMGVVNIMLFVTPPF